ncbi:MAG TPA: CHAP domain-containing protein, partial [Candidatus Dojkabacteria bacterium]
MRKIKKGIYILIVIALSLVTSSPFLVSKSKAVNWCGEYYDPGNPFPCCTQGGNCTWWAIYKRKDLRGVVEGDAGPSWLTQAVNNGYTVQTSIDQKVVGSIAVWGSHVAYVESLGSNGKIFITEMNCESSPPVRSEAYEINVNNHAGTFYGFILRKEVNIKPNIIGISKVDSGSNSTAVHVLNRDTNYQSYLTNTGTVLHQTGNNKQWVFLAADYD